MFATSFSSGQVKDDVRFPQYEQDQYKQVPYVEGSYVEGSYEQVPYEQVPYKQEYNQSYQVDMLYDKLNSLPAPDFSNGIDVKELSLENSDENHEQTPKFKQDFPLSYPTMLSPPETPSMMTMGNPSESGYMAQESGYMSQNPSGGWGRARSDSISWPTEHSPEMPTHSHQRAMSLPHIGMQQQDFGMMQMNFSLPKSYSRKSSVSSTSSDKNFTCSHPGCDRAFSRIQNLRSHMRCHLSTTPHSCKTCGLGFRRTTDLQRHVRTMHVPNDQKPWACPRCPKRFGRSDALKRHMSSRSKDHGCPGGPDLELLRQIDEQKRLKAQKRALETVVEGSAFA